MNRLASCPDSAFFQKLRSGELLSDDIEELGRHADHCPACNDTKVTDLSPLSGMPLKELQCDFKKERDTEILRSIKTLEKINGKPAAEFWKEVKGKKP